MLLHSFQSQRPGVGTRHLVGGSRARTIGLDGWVILGFLCLFLSLLVIPSPPPKLPCRRVWCDLSLLVGISLIFSFLTFLSFLSFLPERPPVGRVVCIRGLIFNISQRVHAACILHTKAPAPDVRRGVMGIFFSFLLFSRAESILIQHAFFYCYALFSPGRILLLLPLDPTIFQRLYCVGGRL